MGGYLPRAKRGFNLTLKTRIERSHDSINKVPVENPILVKELEKRSTIPRVCYGQMRILPRQ
jgi:hypothetical protein